VVAGQSGGWTPIAVEQTSSGYEVAWRYPGSDQFTIWTTDSRGNFATSTGQVSGTSATLLLAEARFHQDLNADGTIGPVASHAIDWHLHV
jgi:serralysin